MHIAKDPLERLRGGWPHYLEVHKGEDGRREHIAVVERRTSQALAPAVQRMLEHLEDAGIVVRIRIVNKNLEPEEDLTLEEFAQFGTHRVRPKRFSTRQEYYNRRSELRSLRKEFASTSDRVRQENLARRIALKECLLSNATHPVKASEGVSLELLKNLQARKWKLTEWVDFSLRLYEQTPGSR